MGLLVFAATAHAQRRGRPVRIALMTYQPRTTNFIVAFEDRLRQLNYVDGANMVLDYRQLARIGQTVGAVAQSLVAVSPDVMVAAGPTESLDGARTATRNIPIVMIAIDYDPLALGYVKSLARPEGNITGLFLRQIELTVKRLELISQLVLPMRRVGFIWDRHCVDQLDEARIYVPRLNLDLVPIELHGENYDYRGALGTVSARRPDILMVGMSPIFFRDRARLFEATNAERLATVCGQREFAEAGAMLTYGANLSAVYQRAAEYVDKIAKGAQPGDLPIEQATVFETVLNLRAARLLGVNVPQAIRLRADIVVE